MDESSAPDVVDNATYTADSLCDSIQFEYVDNVTNTFDGDEKDVDAGAGDQGVGLRNGVLDEKCSKDDATTNMDQPKVSDVGGVCTSPHRPVRTHVIFLKSDYLDTESTRAAFVLKESISTENLANIPTINQNTIKSDLFSPEPSSSASEEDKMLNNTGLSYEADNVTKTANGTPSIPNTKVSNIPNCYHTTDIPDLSRSEHPSSISMYKVLDEVNETTLEDNTKGGYLDKPHVGGNFSSKPKAENIPLNNMDDKNSVDYCNDEVIPDKHQISLPQVKETELMEHFHDDKKHVIVIPDDECQSLNKCGQTGLHSYPVNEVFDDSVLSASASSRPQTSMKEAHKYNNELDCITVDEVDSQECDSFLSNEGKDQTVIFKEAVFDDEENTQTVRFKDRPLIHLEMGSHPAVCALETRNNPAKCALETNRNPAINASAQNKNPVICALETNKSTATCAFETNKSTATCAIETNKSTSTCALETNKSTATRAIETNKSPATCAIETNKSTATCALETNKSTATCAIETNKSTATCALETNKSTVTCAIETNKSTATCAIETNKSTATCAIETNKSTATCAIETNKSTVTCAIETNKSTATCAIETNKSTATCALETTHGAALCPIQKSKDFMMANPKKPIELPRVINEIVLPQIDDKVTQLKLPINGSHITSHDTKSVFDCTKVDFLPIFQQSNEDMHKGQEKDQMTIMKDHNVTKKRHMSSKADIETTPKRHKFGDPLSPIESAMSLRRERGLIEVLEETPGANYETDGCDDDHRAPFSSTPLVPNCVDEKQSHENVRKVIWKVDNDELLDNSMSHALLDDCIENDKEVGGSLNDIYHNQDKMSAVFYDSQIIKQNGDKLDRTVTEKPPSPRNDTKDSNSVPPSIDGRFIASRSKSFNNTQISITDSSYFAMNSSSKLEGRFKDTEATISYIDLDDEDILLSEDVLGLESGYDDSDIDEETLLAEEFADNERQSGTCSNQESFVDRKVLLKEETSIEDKASHSIKDAIIEQFKTTYCDLTAGFEPQHLNTDKKENLADSSKTVDTRIGCEKLEASTCSLVTNLDIDKPELTVGENMEGETPKQKKTTDSTRLLRPMDEVKNLVTTQCKKSAEIEKSETKVVKTNGELQIEVIDTNRISLPITEPNAETGSIDDNNNTNNNNKNLDLMKTSRLEHDLNSTFLDRDEENDVMKNVMRKWQCDGIPSPDVNLTVATTYHKNYSKLNKTGKSPLALLEGEKISCLNLYEDEVKTTHHKMNHFSLTQATYKLRNQKHDLDNMNVMALEAFEQDCYNRCEFLRNRHRKETEGLKKRQTMGFYKIRNHNNIPPFVKQQQLMDLGINHGQERRRLADHQRLEFEALSGELQFRLQTEIEHHQNQVAPVEVLLSQVEKLKSENSQSESVKKYGPTVMVPLRKRPGKDNHAQQATVEICLPLMIAQALSHEEDVYNHFYKF